MRFLLQLWILVFLPVGLFAQLELQFEHVNLPNNYRARTLIQDSQGFIWFASDAHLIRFDGYEFKEFGINPYDSTSLQTGGFDNIVEDFEGNLWFNSFENGLYKFDPATETFQH